MAATSARSRRTAHGGSVAPTSGRATSLLRRLTLSAAPRAAVDPTAGDHHRLVVERAAGPGDAGRRDRRVSSGDDESAPLPEKEAEKKSAKDSAHEEQTAPAPAPEPESQSQPPVVEQPDPDPDQEPDQEPAVNDR
jgi:hypothetical protein